MARAVAPAPFDAKPDGPTCAAELSAHQPRSDSLPGDQFDQYCEVRLAAKANDDTHKSERENLALPLFIKTTNSNPLAFV